MQSTETAVDYDRLTDARTREYLARSPMARQRAVAEFVLSTAQIASDLKRFCDLADSMNKPSRDLEMAIAQAETMIAEQFRAKMGREMF